MKQISSRADLAINGAPQSFDEPLHVGRPNLGDRDQFIAMASSVYDSGWLTNNGPQVCELERQLAVFLGVRNCVAMCNGTVALEIAIRALGMTGEVIVPSFTFIATAHALHWQAIKPVFADIDPATHNLDPDAVRAMITPHTTGIIGVHLWGRPAPVAELEQIASEHRLQLLFDAAHGFGCSNGGRMIGSSGRAEVLSFHATKAFNTLEGGAVVTDDNELAETIRLMRNFGFSGYDNVIHAGTNGKMSELSAGAGLVNLRGFDEIVARNRANHAQYRAQLENVPGLNVLAYDDSERCNYHYIVLEINEQAAISRDALVAVLHAENVLARKYFWPGCHRMLPYRALNPHAGMLLKHTETVANRIVVLPNGQSLTDEAIHQVCSIIRVALS